jgi:hypothetical protein
MINAVVVKHCVGLRQCGLESSFCTEKWDVISLKHIAEYFFLITPFIFSFCHSWSLLIQTLVLNPLYENRNKIVSRALVLFHYVMRIRMQILLAIYAYIKKKSKLQSVSSKRTPSQGKSLRSVMQITQSKALSHKSVLNASLIELNYRDNYNTRWCTKCSIAETDYSRTPRESGLE